ncbi:MAG: SixA phosphatase family protein [Burkholderiales bacterium]
MDLILWRHAEAEDGSVDLERELTAKGHKQAARVAEWLLQRLPAGFALMSSPALRAAQTARALGIPAKTFKALAPGAAVSDILQAAGWPGSRNTVVLVGHQPDLGQAAAYLVAGSRSGLSIKKGGLWWITHRMRGDDAQVVVRAVMSPDLL